MIMGKSEKIRFFEEIAANGHVALNVMQYDGWLLRFSEGYTGRANSVSIIYPSTLDMAEKVAYCEEMYRRKGQPCIFKLTNNDEELGEYLESRGYKVVTPTDVKVLDLARFEPVETDGCVFDSEPDEKWLENYFAFEKLTDTKKQDIFRRMLAKVSVDTIYCTLYDGGRVVACASAAVEHGYMLLQNVVVDESARGTGYGKRLCSAIITKAKESGAKYSWLQVVKDNIPAVKLYDRLGYEKLYTYWYMRKDT